jgi:hypothetical protein
VDYVDEYNAVIEAVQTMLVEETQPWVDAGSAVLELGEGGGSLRPSRPGACAVAVYVQSDSEVSLFPTVPGTDRTPTVDIYDKHRAALVQEVREYVRAFLEGRVELTLRKGSSNGRVRVSLPDGRANTHHYNVVLGFFVGRGPGWDTFRPAPY